MKVAAGQGQTRPSNAPCPSPAPPREGGGATATRAPPAGFVRAWNPAVAAPQNPLPPEGAHFRAAHHPDRVRSRCASRAQSCSCPLRGRPAPVAPEMPVDFTGYWKMLANENFEEYLRALGKLLLRLPLGAEGWAPQSPPQPVARQPPPGLAAAACSGRRLGGWGLLGLIGGKHLTVGSRRG